MLQAAVAAAPSGSGSAEITRLLLAWQQGEPEAAERVMPMVLSELRQIAAACLARERRPHTLQPTALVNEAFLRLIGQRSPWQTRTHFFAVAARLIRFVLTDYARKVQTAKRGERRPLPLEAAAEVHLERPQELVELDAALARLAELDPVKARVVEYRYFAGLTGEEIAAVEGISPATVHRHWQLARAWLFRELGGGGGLAS